MFAACASSLFESLAAKMQKTNIKSLFIFAFQ